MLLVEIPPLTASVPLVVIFAAAVPVVSTAPVSVVLPLPATCVTETALTPADSVTFFALVMLIAPRRLFAAVLPAAPVNRMLPPVPALSVTGSAPLVVPSSLPLNVMLPPAALPLAVVSIVNSPVPAVFFSVTFLAKLTASAVVVMVRSVLMVTAPAPVCATAPSAEISALRVKVPALTKVRVPPAVVVI